MPLLCWRRWGARRCRQGQCPPVSHPPCRSGAGPRAITNVRLTGGPSVREGTLEVETGGQWVAACASLSSPDAHLRTAALACARLGFGARGAVRLGNFYGSAASGSSARDVWCEEGGFPAPDLSYCRVGSSCRPGSQLGVACAGEGRCCSVRSGAGAWCVRGSGSGRALTQSRPALNLHCAMQALRR